MKKEQQIKSLIIQDIDIILNALKKMDIVEKKLLLVFQEERFLNVLSIGDIQRAILNNYSLDTQVKEIMRSNTKMCHSSESYDEIRRKMIEYRIECMPVINENKQLVDIYFWEDIFPNTTKLKNEILDLPVVIMAGGIGSRLKPLTNVFPKPLIPIGEKTIVENIMDRFASFGCNAFYMSLNYKAELIKYFFKSLDNKSYNIQFFEEEKPLGTAGSLFLLKGKIDKTFFVSNCDILITEDYSEILKYHIKNQNELTIVSALLHYPIPYGTIDTGKQGKLVNLKEKPELVFQINTGMYIVEPHLLDEVPDNTFFHITDLISKINVRNGNVGVFPVSEKSWMDIGDWTHYLNYLNK